MIPYLNNLGLLHDSGNCKKCRDKENLIDAIESALIQAHKEGKKEMREECAKIVESFGYNQTMGEFCKEIAQNLRELK